MILNKINPIENTLHNSILLFIYFNSKNNSGDIYIFFYYSITFLFNLYTYLLIIIISFGSKYSIYILFYFIINTNYFNILFNSKSTNYFYYSILLFIKLSKHFLSIYFYSFNYYKLIYKY